jgi:glucose-specific phosphotransferase system IIA component
MKARDAFFQRIATSLIIPVTVVVLAATLLAVGVQLHIHPVEAAGLALIRSWLPLVFAVSISIGFTGEDGMGALAAALGFLAMSSTAEAVSGDPSINLGVLGGVVAGILCTWTYNRTKRTQLPEYLALLSGKRFAVLMATLVGILLGYPFGFFWPVIFRGIVALGHWVYGAGAAGVFVYGSVLRLLIPTGLHHILMQLVDYQLGGWTDPAGGQQVAGEYLRFLAGDPTAGRLLSGFFVTLGFSNCGAALAIIHEARPEQRRRVAGLMTTGILTGFVLGVTEPVEFAYIFASPALFGLHVLFSGLASLLAYALNIHMGGYGLPMVLFNWHRQQNAWLLFPLGLAFLALYYFSFRAVIRWLRPPILGQVPEGPEPEEVWTPAKPDEEGVAYLAALGGAGNITGLEACMTRLRLQVREPGAVHEARLKRLGATGVLRPGQGQVQVVVGARAGDLASRIRAAMAEGGGAVVVTIVSPVSGRVLPLAEVPDPVFAGGMVGEGIAVEAEEGTILAPVAGRVVHIFPGGHAVGLITPGGLEVLVHVGIDTVSLNGEGFRVTATEGQEVLPGEPLGRFDPRLIAGRGKSLVTPVLITNPDRLAGMKPLVSGRVRAGEPLLRIELNP